MSSDYEISDDENYSYEEEDDEMDVEDYDDGAHKSRHTTLLNNPEITDTHDLCAGSASEIEVDGIGEDFKVAGRSERKVYEVDYSSLTQQEVEKIMATEVNYISGIFGVEVSGPCSHNSI